MDTRYRAALMAGGLLCVAMPAFGQPASLLSPLSDQPTASEYAGNQQLLAVARNDVEGERWNAAEVALERSETVLLNNGSRTAAGVVTSPSLAMSYIIQARGAVAQRDQVDALLAIDKAASKMTTPGPLSAPATDAIISGAPPSGNTVTVPAPAASSAPMVTKALLPGHWQLVGWQYHWVPPDSSYRSVQRNPFIPGHYEYREGAWVWVAGHYGSNAS